MQLYILYDYVLCCEAIASVGVCSIKLSVQIRPWDTLACCWDVKQPTNKQTIHQKQDWHIWISDSYYTDNHLKRKSDWPV